MHVKKTKRLLTGFRLELTQIMCPSCSSFSVPRSLSFKDTVGGGGALGHQRISVEPTVEHFVRSKSPSFPSTEPRYETETIGQLKPRHQGGTSRAGTRSQRVCPAEQVSAWGRLRSSATPRRVKLGRVPWSSRLSRV